MSSNHPVPLTDFTTSGGVCAPDQFKAEIEAAQQSGAISKVLIGDPQVDFVNCNLTFGAALDGDESAALTALANAHTGAGLPPPNVTHEGYEIVAETWERTMLDPVWRSFLYTPTAKANESDDPVYNFFDEPISTELLLRGGWYELMSAGAHLGDMIEFSVVDKDDILGLFGAYGLTQGVDVLELSKFVKTEYVHPGEVGVEHDFTTRGGFRLVAGLYMRFSYIATGTSAPNFKIRLVYQE